MPSAPFNPERLLWHLFIIFIWDLEFLSQDHLSFFCFREHWLSGRSTNHKMHCLAVHCDQSNTNIESRCSGKPGKVMVSTLNGLGLNTPPIHMYILLVYRTRAIISRGLYTFYKFF
jgi:hypothetical protein